MGPKRPKLNSGVPPQKKTDNEEKIISMVQERSCLFDKRCANYKNAVMREAKWVEIEKELNMTARECKAVWDGLRNQYVKFLPKLKLVSGTGAKARPYFRHENAMRFMKDIVDPDENTLSNLDEPNGHTSASTTEEDLETAPENELEVENMESTTEGAERRAPLAQVVPPSSITNPNGSTSTNFRKRKMDQFDQELLGLLKNNDGDDEFQSFAKSLVPKFRIVSQTDRRAYIQLQRKIYEAVLDAELDILI